MDKLVEKAFTSLSDTCNKESLHVSDEDKIKVTLKVLCKKKVPIDIDALEDFLVDKGWQDKPIRDVLKWAEALKCGGRVQLKFKQMAPSEQQVLDAFNA